jgi:hypothetical protein
VDGVDERAVIAASFFDALAVAVEASGLVWGREVAGCDGEHADVVAADRGDLCGPVAEAAVFG